MSKFIQNGQEFVLYSEKEKQLLQKIKEKDREIEKLSEELYAKNLQKRLDYKGIFDEGYEKGYMDTWDKVTKEILNYKKEIAELKELDKFHSKEKGSKEKHGQISRKPTV
jgi:Zn-dependent M32 family carboxypeptidase